MHLIFWNMFIYVGKKKKKEVLHMKEGGLGLA